MKKAFYLLFAFLFVSCSWDINTENPSVDEPVFLSTKAYDKDLSGSLWDCNGGLDLRIGYVTEASLYARNLYFDTEDSGYYFLTEKVKTVMVGGWDDETIEVLLKDTTFVLASKIYPFTYSVKHDTVFFDNLTVPSGFPEDSPSYGESTIDYATFGCYRDIKGTYPDRPALEISVKYGNDHLGYYFEPSMFQIENLVEND